MTTPPASTPADSGASDASLSTEIRNLVQQMQKSGSLGFDPATFIKGTVTAFDFAGAPPTLTINIGGDTTTEISDIRLLNNYSPEIGHTVLVGKQGSTVAVLGHISELSAFTVDDGAGGWVRANLTHGTHGGGGQGDIYYRRIQDHGTWKVQWRGSWGVDSSLLMLDTSDSVQADAYRPSSRRVIVAARSGSNGGTASMTWVFDPDGTVYVDSAGGTAGGPATVTGEVGNTSSGTGGATASHIHADPQGSTTGSESSDHGHSYSHGHPFSGGAHTHSIPLPTWASLNGVEYFL